MDLIFYFCFFQKIKSQQAILFFFLFDLLPKIHPNVTDKNVNRVHVFPVDANILRATIAKGKSAFSRLILFSTSEDKSTKSYLCFS